MTAYSYRASTAEGKIVEGTMEASDDGTVSLKLQEMGLIPVRIGSATRQTIFSRQIEWPWKGKKVRSKDVLVFTQELHTLIRAGFPLDRSLTVLRQLAESKEMADVLQGVLKEVKGGKSFSEALGKYPEVFPKVYLNMIRAGEAGGALEEILGRLATYLVTSDDLRSYIIGSLIYPALLSAVAVASVIILTLFVVPRFASIFQDMGVALPLPMAILRGLSTFLTRFWWLVLALILIAGLYFKRFRQSPEGRMKWDRWLLRIPLVGIVLRKLEVARFSRVLGTLLHGGVPLLQAMTIGREVLGNQSIAEAVDPIRNGIKKGEGIAQPMKQSGVFPPLAMHLIEVGEESGRLDGMLLQVADVYDTEVRNSIKNLIAFFEPALILLMGIVIGAIVVSMLTAIFSINDIPL
ncbi:MAG TPA: type II secretion system F family protein [Acidobacteriota bacterium]|nr:type II secretion system F family protein [Acidobacteriota bacterium]